MRTVVIYQEGNTVKLLFIFQKVTPGISIQ